MFTHITSDLHVGHKSIIGFCDRPYKDVDEMNQALLDNYNAVVGPDDFVLFVGDVSMGMKLSKLKTDFLDKLNGRKALVRGNHDSAERKCLKMGFEFVVDRLWMDLEGVPALVCHYPPKGAKDTHRANDERYWDRRPEYQQGVVHVHGHTHESMSTFQGERRIHIGVDAWNYTPVAMADLVTLAHKLVRPI